MATKRVLDSDPATSSSPRKRHRLSTSTPRTPFLTSRYHSSFRNTPYTPFTPHTPYPSRPSDSPTNPFSARNSQKRLRALPTPTRFSKHLPLRFQLITLGSSSSLTTPVRLGGVHRIVQVPLSYTFTHLRCLLFFLFPSTNVRHSKNARMAAQAHDEHLFEVQQDITMYSPLYRPGQIRLGKTWAKLSTVRDPCRVRSRSAFSRRLTGDEDGLCEDNEVDEEEDGDEDPTNEDIRHAKSDWDWEDEEEFKLSRVWPEGVDLTRGVIYHHSPTIQVHITLNTQRLPRRKGSSNTPYVFSGRGRVALAPSIIPRPVFGVKDVDPDELLGSTITEHQQEQSQPESSLLTPPLEDGEDIDGDDPESARFFTSSHPFRVINHSPNLAYGSPSANLDEEEVEEDPLALLNVDDWNAEHAFERYLTQFMGAHPSFDVDGEEDEQQEDSRDLPNGCEDGYESGFPYPGESSEFGDDCDTNDKWSTPGLSFAHSSSPPHLVASSPSSVHDFPSSSPARLQTHSFSCPPSNMNADASLSHITNTYLMTSYPKYTTTPAPPRSQRMRIARAARKVERTKKGAYIRKWDDEDEDDNNGAVEDQLEEDNLDEDGVDTDSQILMNAPKKWNAMRLGKNERRMCPLINKDEEWDPFGDEIEV